MQTELSRLADVCRNESVPDAFQTFVAGIPTLTKTERRIFDGYAAGLRTREIAQQLDHQGQHPALPQQEHLR